MADTYDDIVLRRLGIVRWPEADDWKNRPRGEAIHTSECAIWLPDVEPKCTCNALFDTANYPTEPLPPAAEETPVFVSDIDPREDNSAIAYTDEINPEGYSLSSEAYDDDDSFGWYDEYPEDDPFDEVD